MLMLASAAIVVLTSVIFVLVYVQAAYEMPMTLKVINNGATGFDLNTSVVAFGRLHPGEISDRYFDVNNTGTTSVKVIVKTFGDVTPWVQIEPQPLFITPEQGHGSFKATATVPFGAVEGSYTGRMLVIVLRE
jgi:hypothetical protein